MKAEIKALISDTKVEPLVRWLVKRIRGNKIRFELVKNEIYDRQAFEVMRRVLSPISNCVDIGCHRGRFMREILKYAPDGHHFAFEPIPQLAAQLRDAFPSAQVFDLALSDKSGEAPFYIFAKSPARSGLNRRDFLRHAEPRQATEVRTERLDALLPPDIRVAFIKIDVEGAEGLVIAGALDTIKRDRPFIVFEDGTSSNRAFGIPRAKIYDLLVHQCGLHLSLLPHWLSGKRPLTEREFAEQREWYFLAHPATNVGAPLGRSSETGRRWPPQ